MKGGAHHRDIFDREPRNNPLRFVDPTGQAIQLTGETEDELKKELEAIQASLVNRKVSGNLYVNPELDRDGKQTGRFFVGIKEMPGHSQRPAISRRGWLK